MSHGTKRAKVLSRILCDVLATTALLACTAQGVRRRGGAGSADMPSPPALEKDRSACGLTPAAVHQAQYGYAPLVMVGDGATDAEARQPGGADIFIGYGGAVRRPAVAAAADWYVLSIQPLLDALE